MGRQPAPNRGLRVVVFSALLAAGIATATTSIGVSPVSAAGAPYSAEVPAGGFETPALNSGQYVYRPTNGTWTFTGESGVSRSGSSFTNGIPAIPQGTQVAFVQRAGKIVQRFWVQPGDVVNFKATQRVNANFSLQSISVVVDGIPQGSAITPPRNSWSSYSVPISVSSTQRVNLEIRGNTTASTDVTAFIDDVSITRLAVDIADTGIPAQAQRAILDTRTEPMAAGVLGVLKVGDSENQLDTPVQAFAEWNGVMYVGGKFANVQRGTGAPLQNQAYLAAFDLATGAWIDTFRPVLDGTVWDLAVTADGKLIVGGQFTNINGVSSTAGLAALDPATGAVLANWKAGLTLTTNTMRPFVRAIKVVGSSVYVGGNYNRITGPDGVVRSAARVNRLSATDGIPVRGWVGNIGGQVYDLDVNSGRVYAVGKFSTVNGEARNSLAILDATTGASIPGMKQMLFTTTDASRYYQQAVVAFPDQVWVGGSEHSTQVYSTTDLTRLRVFTSNPYGDIQTLATVNGYMYGGSHANPNTNMYTDATHYTQLTGWTTKDPVKWIGAYDIANRTFVPTWVPQVGVSNGEGGWELFVDSQNCMWAGGDFDRGSSTLTGFQYAQGFTKFCPVDSTVPTAPSAASATLAGTGVSIAWGASTDESPGAPRYEVFRNDRPIASGLNVRSYVDPAGTVNDRYFVRAVDAAGNRSATTPVVLVGPDQLKPTAPTNFSGVTAGDNKATLTWTASTDNVGVVGYKIWRNGVEIQTVVGTSVTLIDQPIGSTFYQVSAFDAAGNDSSKTASVNVTITGPDTVKPSIPKDLVGVPGADGEAVLTWTASTDNIGVVGYNVYRGGAFVQSVTNPTATVTGMALGSYSFQVSAFDAAGNESSRTASVTVTVTGPDLVKPTVPKDLVGVPGADGEAVLTWTASTDNVGVTGYNVYRSGVLVQTVTTTTATITGLAIGNNFFQVSAVDAAANESSRTSSVTVAVTGPDTVKPTLPKDLVGTVQPNGDVVLTWTASTDNVGVTGYTVFQGGVAVQTVPSNTATITGLTTGTYSFQVQAFDAANNLSTKTASISVPVP